MRTFSINDIFPEQVSCNNQSCAVTLHGFVPA